MKTAAARLLRRERQLAGDDEQSRCNGRPAAARRPRVDDAATRRRRERTSADDARRRSQRDQTASTAGTSGARPARKSLPRTASSLALFELLSGLSLAGGFAAPRASRAVGRRRHARQDGRTRERRESTCSKAGRQQGSCVRRSCLVVAALPRLLFAALPALFAQEPASAAAPTELVVLPVVVTDGRAATSPISRREHFAVFDNGRRVPIELFTNEDTPVTVGLVIDASGSMRPKIGEVVAAALAFARSSNPQDELFAVRFNDDVSEAIAERPFLLGGRSRGARGGGHVDPARRPDRALRRRCMAGLDHLAHGTRARKVLVVISDGGDNASEATLDSVLARARESNAAIYTIGIFDDDDHRQEPARAEVARRDDRRRTVSAALARAICCSVVRAASRARFAAATPSATCRPTATARIHRVRVVVDPTPPRRLNVRTRPGYFAAGARLTAMSRRHVLAVARTRAARASASASRAWCAAVLVEARFHNAAPLPRAGQLRSYADGLPVLPGDAGDSADTPPPAPAAGTLLGRLEAPSVKMSTSVLEGSDDGTLEPRRGTHRGHAVSRPARQHRHRRPSRHRVPRRCATSRSAIR